MGDDTFDVSVTFRWSLSKIRRVATGGGIVMVFAVSAYVLWSVFYEGPALGSSRLSTALGGLVIAAVAGVLAVLFSAGVLLIGRVGSKTVVSLEGLCVQRSLWHKHIVHWSDIKSVRRRDFSGWRYLVMQTSANLLEVSMSAEFDSPSDFSNVVARFAPPGNPLRDFLSSHGT